MGPDQVSSPSISIHINDNNSLIIENVILYAKPYHLRGIFTLNLCYDMFIILDLGS